MGLRNGSGATEAIVSAKLSVISLSPDPGQLVLFPMVVNKASIQFFLYLGCKVLLYPRTALTYCNVHDV